MLIRTASAILNSSGSIGRSVPGTREPARSAGGAATPGGGDGHPGLGEVRGDQTQAVGIPALVEPRFVTPHCREGRALQLRVEPVAQELAVGETVVLGEIPGTAGAPPAGPEVLKPLVGDLAQQPCKGARVVVGRKVGG